jgi:regulator of ribonuclease activity B
MLHSGLAVVSVACATKSIRLSSREISEGIFDFLRKKQMRPDEAVMSPLGKAGSNMSKPHPVEFFLYFPAEQIARQAAEKIRLDGFEANVRPAATGDQWLCFATKPIEPSLENMENIRREFTALAASLGREYDGWGTPIVK